MTHRAAYLALFMALLALLTGCVETNEPLPEFTGTGELSLRINGKTIMKYEPLTWQLSCNTQKKQFRVHNDTMSDFYVLTCSELPDKKGQQIKADLLWTSSRINKQNGLTFIVLSILGDGTVWLYNRKLGAYLSIRKPEDFS